MKIFLTLILILSPITVYAQGSGVEAPFANQQLDDPVLEAEAANLMKSLRCIQCQGQSIADSDAPIAGAMRSEVRQRIMAGDEPEEIREWLISRYGEWVSFDPPLYGAGLFLWLVPFLLLGFGIWAVRGLFRGAKS